MNKSNIKIEYVNIELLKPSEYNPRKATQKECEDLKKSINKFGIVDPIIVNSSKTRKNIIIGGHFRFKICQELGYKQVPVVYIDISDIEKEQELNIRLNKNSGKFDYDLLANFNEEILLDIGFDSVALDDIFEIEPDEKDDEIPPGSQKTNINIGDLFQLNEHRLLCGDCTKKENVAKLINNKMIDLVLTDPPYGINIVKVGGGGKTKFGKVGGRNIVKANLYRPIINDDKEFNPEILLQYGKNQIIFGGNFFSNKLPNSYCWIVWDKKTGGNNFSDCELAWTSFKKPIKLYSFLWAGLRREGNRKEELKNRVHPTQKPVGLMSNILQDFTNKNNIIMDLFLGSGSTLIACEKTKRKCYGMELDPIYCQVIIDRWEKYTGEKAKKIS